MRSLSQHDCFTPFRCYRVTVSMTISRTGGAPAAAMMLGLALAIAGCQATDRQVSSTPSPTAQEVGAAAPLPPSPAWWSQLNDPVLAALVQRGLDNDVEVACRINGLRSYDRDLAQQARRIGAKLGRLLGDKSVHPDPQARQARIERVASRRERTALQIALAYVEVRHMQQDVALRASLRDQYKDNAEVAQFRREAGLVSAIDGSLARSQDETAQGELGFAQGRLESAIAELARLVGDTPEAVAARLGPPGVIVEPPVDPLADAAPEDPRRAKLADAVLREARLSQALAESRRTVKDARAAYREGAGNFPTLYVSEAAAHAVELALGDARASRVDQMIALLAGKDDAWARQGLDPVVPDPTVTTATITVTPACD